MLKLGFKVRHFAPFIAARRARVVALSLSHMGRCSRGRKQEEVVVVKLLVVEIADDE